MTLTSYLTYSINPKHSEKPRNGEFIPLNRKAKGEEK
jgi:hypothetical protein